jgi:flagellar M-ring protein FliF
LTNQVPANAQAPIANPPANAAAAAQQQGGATTTATNGTAGAGGAAATAPTNVRSDSTVNYEVDRTISHVKQPTGAVKRLSVAVVVNYVKNADGEAQPLPPEELTKLTNLVREAMGFSQDRGDSLNLVNSRFTDETIAEIPLWKDPGMIDLAKTIGYWLVLLLAALWVWRALLRPMWNRYINPEVDPVVAEIERAEAQREAIDQARASANSRYEENMQRAREMATKDPRAVAMVLRTWMSSNDK